MTNDELRALHQQAGVYPELEARGNPPEGAYYDCPLCSGQGSIDAECVRDGTSSHGTGLNVSIVGVQVFGFGHGMEAMEKLIPAMVDELPRLLRESDELRALKAQHGIT